MALNYIPPTVIEGKCIVKVDEKEMEKMIKVWDRSIALFVVGYLPSLESISEFIVATWNFAVKPRVFSYDEGYYVVHFQSMEDCNEMLFGGPYTMGRKMALVKKWSPNLCGFFYLTYHCIGGAKFT